MKLRRILVVIFIIQTLINLLGALSPEISFDALWYHLPISRLIIERGWWGVIPGGLLYTSGTPRLMEFVNAGLLWVGTYAGMLSPEILPKVLHWGLGLASARMIYLIAMRYWEDVTSWIAVVVWYSSLVVGWQSMVVYVDLARTFLVLVGVWFILEMLEKKEKYAWIWAGVALGVGYSVKVLVGFDAIFMLGLLLVVNGKKHWREVLGIGLIVGLFGLFWGWINLIQGYHLFYPFYGLNTYLSTNFSLIKNHILSPLYVFWHPAYRTGPVVILLLVLGWKSKYNRVSKSMKVLSLAIVLSWWYAPANLFKGDGRYFLPSLAMLSVVAAGVYQVSKGRLRSIVIAIVLFSALLGVVYRGYANVKFMPYLLQVESKEEFLLTYLQFDNGDWYDVNGEVAEIVGDSRYLVYGVHNTYYLPGNYDHQSWKEEDYCYPYVLVQGGVVSQDNWEKVQESIFMSSVLYKQECGDSREM